VDQTGNIAVEQVRFESCAPADKQDWSALRHELWPEASIEEHREENTQPSNHQTRFAAFLCRTDSGIAIGFAETERVVYYRKQL
jgi:aminoglycoside 6'-N-acetyltransferase I